MAQRLSKCCHPITFRLSPFRLHCWCRGSYYPLPVSLYKSVSQPITPLICSFIFSFGSLVAHFFLGSMVGDHHACSPAHWLNPSGSFSYISYRHCAVSACKLYFFISYFVLAYTYLFSAKLRSGCLFSFRPYVDCLRPWTMIFPWIFLFLYRHVFACSNKQNEYSQINPRRTTFPRRFVASNKLNINQLKF